MKAEASTVTAHMEKVCQDVEQLATKPSDDALMVACSFCVKSLARGAARLAAMKATGSAEFMKEYSEKIRGWDAVIADSVRKLLAAKEQAVWRVLESGVFKFLVDASLGNPVEPKFPNRLQERLCARATLQAMVLPSEAGFEQFVDSDKLNTMDEVVQRQARFAKASCDCVMKIELVDEDHSGPIDVTTPEFVDLWRSTVEDAHFF